jgi:hypothetical protein
VRLHDTGLIGVELKPIDRTLTLQFEYKDPLWTPPEAAPMPVVVMRFDEVTIREWEHVASDGGHEPPADVDGQVENFEYDDGETFRLTTYAFTVEIAASRRPSHLSPPLIGFPPQQPDLTRLATHQIAHQLECKRCELMRASGDYARGICIGHDAN